MYKMCDGILLTREGLNTISVITGEGGCHAGGRYVNCLCSLRGNVERRVIVVAVIAMLLLKREWVLLGAVITIIIGYVLVLLNEPLLTSVVV